MYFFNVATSHGRSLLYLALILHVSYVLMVVAVVLNNGLSKRNAKPFQMPGQHL